MSPLEATSVASTTGQSKRVVLEVRFVNTALDALDPDQTAGLWQWVDETSIDARQRQRLLENGVRVGLVANESRFLSRLESFAVETDVVEEFLSQASVASDVSHGDQRIPIRLGRRYELALRQPFEGSHVGLVSGDGEVTGRTLNNAQYFLAFTATAADSVEQLRLRIRPEIQYGAARPKWVSSDTAIRIDTRRETWALDMLSIDVLAAQGDTIVMAPDTPTRGLASKMLIGNGTDQDPEQLLVLIRVARIPSPADKLVARIP